MHNENYVVIPDAGIFFFFLALLMREEIRSGEPDLTQTTYIYHCQQHLTDQFYPHKTRSAAEMSDQFSRAGR